MAEEKVLPGRIVPAGFANQGLQPPSDLFVSGSDALVLTSYNSATGTSIHVRGILLRTDGVAVPFQFIQVPNADRSAKTTVIPLTEGFLLSAAVFLGSGSAKRGQCYVQLMVARGIETSQVLHRILTQGYVGTAINLTWPGNRLEQPTEGPGFMRAVTGTDRAAGVEILETVPTGARWSLHSMFAQLTTDATVANRIVRLALSDGVNFIVVTPGPANQTASTSWSYNWFKGAVYFTSPSIQNQSVPMPIAAVLLAGYAIQTTTVNIVAGDNWGAPELFVEEWIEP